MPFDDPAAADRPRQSTGVTELIVTPLFGNAAIILLMAVRSSPCA